MKNKISFLVKKEGKKLNYHPCRASCEMVGEDSTLHIFSLLYSFQGNRTLNLIVAQAW